MKECKNCGRKKEVWRFKGKTDLGNWYDCPCGSTHLCIETEPQDGVLIDLRRYTEKYKKARAIFLWADAGIPAIGYFKSAYVEAQMKNPIVARRRKNQQIAQNYRLKKK